MSDSDLVNDNMENKWPIWVQLVVSELKRLDTALVTHISENREDFSELEEEIEKKFNELQNVLNKHKEDIYTMNIKMYIILGSVGLVFGTSIGILIDIVLRHLGKI